MKPDKRQKVTVKEIARKAGVSVSTVSRVMSGTDTAIPISEKTRDRVLAVCEELKFLPDVNYTRLQERRSYIVAMLVPRFHPDGPMPFFSDENIGLFMTALDSGLSKAKYSILIQGVDEDYETSRQYLKILRNNTADGLIIWDAFQSPEAVELLNEEHRPALCVAFPYHTARNYIVPDNLQGAYDITRHLLDLGHRRIVYISGGKGEPVDIYREQGYRKAMEEFNLPMVVYNGGYNFKGGYACGERILGEYPETTAIFAANDLMAIGAMEHAKLQGKRIPEDLAIAGFDGSSHAAVATPKITTGRLPMQEIGKLAAESILAMIEHRQIDPVQLTLPIEIIKRGSTVPSGAPV